MKKILPFIVSIATLVIILFKIYKDSLNFNLTLDFSVFSVALYACSIFCIFLSCLMSSLRFYTLARAFKLNLNFRKALKLNLIGFSYSQILPSSIGGDVIKAILLKKEKITFFKIINLIVLDRFYGLLLLFFLVLGSINLITQIPEIYNFLNYLKFYYNSKNLIILGLILVFVIVWFLNFLKQRFARLVVYVNSFGAVKWVSTSTIVLSISFLNFICIAASFYFILQSLNLTLNFLILIKLIPIVLIFSSMPIFFNGWGGREIILIPILGYLNLSTHLSFLASALFGFGNLILAFVCYLIIHTSNENI